MGTMARTRLPFLSLLVLLSTQNAFGIEKYYKSSLTFVIDDTSSMSDDIVEVKINVNAIFDTVLRNNASQIENFVLVTFNDDGYGDPGVIVRSNTKDREEFRDALSAIDVHGGDDCPEYAMTGIKKALEESFDRSYLYVFTDATAKDYEDFEELKAFAQQKQTQIVFVLTMDYCSTPISSKGHREYYLLAAATDGQVFNLRKGEVGKLLGYVNRTVTGRRTTLVNEKLPPGKNNMIFDVDAIMGEITLSLASVESNDPSVTIKAPDGSNVYKKIIFETDQIQIYSVDSTMPGAHTVEVNCKAETQAVISARSGIDFQHGFSAYKLASLVDTSATPAPGKSHLSIKLNEGDIELQTVQILDMNDNVKMELPLEVINIDSKFYTTPAFDPPNIMFKIAIIGYDPKSNSNITRKAPTPVEVFKPPPGKKIEDKRPSISMRDVINAKYDEPLQVVCRVNGYPQPSIVWKNKDKGTVLSGEVSPLILPYVYTSVLSIEKVQENMTYECEASNSLGSDSKQVIITTIVLNKFNVLDTPQRVQVEYQKECQISCVVDAYPPAHIVWFKNESRLKPNDNIMITDNNTTVTIKHATPTDGGKYGCLVKNAFKKKKIYRYVTVTGTETPEVDKSTSDVTVTKGSSVVLECKILKGIPKPTITWYHSSSNTLMYEVTAWQDRERVFVSVRDKFDAGSYMCEAKNDVGADYHEMTLKLQYPPSIPDSDFKTISVAAGAKLSIPCHADGSPKPHVTWYKDGVEITNSDRVDIFGDQTLRFVVQPSDTGLYACKATNGMGSVTKTVKVDIIVPVNLNIPRESKLKALIGERLTLPCEASGDPEPSIKWFFHAFSSSAPQTIRSTLKILQLNDLQGSDEGYYTCVASNAGGAMNITYEVHVLAPPSIKESDNSFEVVAGDYALRIPCESSGNPKPTIIWKKDGLNLALGLSYYMSEGTLIISNVPKNASGTYTCVAENSVGTATEKYHVTVLDDIIPSSPTSSVVLEQGKSAEINCTIPHKTIISDQRWYKDGTFIKSGKLTFANPDASDSGDYTCRVSDFLETVSSTTRVIFGKKPELTFSEGDEDIELSVGSDVSLNCENRGEPKPEVEWYRDDEKLDETEAEYELPMDKLIPGQYKCIIKNALGSITKNFNIVPRDCFINTKKMTNTQPLMLTPRLKWPLVDKIEEFMVLSRGEQFILVCPTRFTTIPRQDVIGFCDGGTKFLMSGLKYDYSEIQCTEEVKHVVQRKGSECIEGRKDTESLSIGYKINRKIKEIAEVYEVCWNKTSETPIYAKHTMPITPPGAEYNTTWLDNDKFKINFDEAYDCDHQINAISAQLGHWFHRDDKCCFSKRQLVSPRDVFSGVPQISTFSYYNVVPHWSTCNTENWDEVEQRVRNLAYELNMELLVWTGTANELSLKGRSDTTSRLLMDKRGYQQSVSTYLWKVVQDPDVTLSSLAIIQVNVPDLSPADVSKYVLCEDQCDRVDWMRNPDWHDVTKGYTYCCKIDEFETAFELTNIFTPGMTSLLILGDYEFVPESSLTL